MPSWSWRITPSWPKPWHWPSTTPVRCPAWPWPTVRSRHSAWPPHEPRCGRDRPRSRRRGRLQDHPGAPGDAARRCTSSSSPSRARPPVSYKVPWRRARPPSSRRRQASASWSPPSPACPTTSSRPTAGRSPLCASRPQRPERATVPRPTTTGPRTCSPGASATSSPCWTAAIDLPTASDRLGISVNTTRGYVKNLYRKLDVHSQVELLAVARDKGLLDETAG